MRIDRAAADEVSNAVAHAALKKAAQLLRDALNDNPDVLSAEFRTGYLAACYTLDKFAGLFPNGEPR